MSERWDDFDLSLSFSKHPCLTFFAVTSSSKDNCTTKCIYFCLVCPQSIGFTYNSDDNTCFKVAPQAVEWSAASAECHALHPRAHLLVINDQPKQIAFKNFYEYHGEWMISYNRHFRNCAKFLSNCWKSCQVSDRMYRLGKIGHKYVKMSDRVKVGPKVGILIRHSSERRS